MPYLHHAFIVVIIIAICISTFLVPRFLAFYASNFPPFLLLSIDQFVHPFSSSTDSSFFHLPPFQRIFYLLLKSFLGSLFRFVEKNTSEKLEVNDVNMKYFISNIAGHFYFFVALLFYLFVTKLDFCFYRFNYFPIVFPFFSDICTPLIFNLLVISRKRCQVCLLLIFNCNILNLSHFRKSYRYLINVFMHFGWFRFLFFLYIFIHSILSSVLFFNLW